MRVAGHADLPGHEAAMPWLSRGPAPAPARAPAPCISPASAPALQPQPYSLSPSPIARSSSARNAPGPPRRKSRPVPPTPQPRPPSARRSERQRRPGRGDRVLAPGVHVSLCTPLATPRRPPDPPPTIVPACSRFPLRLASTLWHGSSGLAGRPPECALLSGTGHRRRALMVASTHAFPRARCGIFDDSPP